MPTVTGVRLRHAAKPVLLDTSAFEDLTADDILVLSTDRGTELGRVSSAPRDLAPGESADPGPRIARKATREDLELAEQLHKKEREAMPIYRRLVNKHKLDMKPTDVEYTFDGGKVVFYFVAEERVDFRDLVRDLASEFHSRVDMRQIGVRDEARLVGGLGHCGEQLCCVRFGGEFQPVSIRMAKEQDLPLNPLKISGLCGRLMCCLRYENEAYKDFKGRAPRKGTIVEVGDGLGKVVEFNTPKETVTMRLEQGGSVTVKLSDMDCKSGQGCPCRVKAEALAPAAPSLTGPVGQIATIATPSSKSQEPSASPSAPERTPRRKRRRGSGEAPAAASEQQPGKAETPAKPQRTPRQRQGGRGQQGQQKPSGPQAGSGGQQPSVKPAGAEGGQGAPPAQQPKQGAPSGRRRRRRSSGPGPGAGAAPQQ